DDLYDIAIIGAGPAGLALSTLLSRWGYRIFHIDNRATPTPTGRADGIQPRSLELLKNMGLKNAIMKHAPAKVFEVAFWESDAADTEHIVRTGTHPSCPSFIDTRYPFTTLLHQGLIERVFIEEMAKYGTHVIRPWEIVNFQVDDTNSAADGAVYPVQVTVRKALASSEVNQRHTLTVRAKYLFGGEGGRSFVRQKLGFQMKYRDPTQYVWAVMDGVVRTTFPDIKMKCTIRSSHGSIMVIPREANMVRLYIQLVQSSNKSVYDSDAEWRHVTAEQVQAAAKKVFSPYEIEWENVEWYSVYPIGQGVSEGYSAYNERVFIGGDATHTHSPKAGQGMNTAFLDSLNLAWKIHLVESRFADRSILKTYQSERKLVADKLLDFDSKYAKLFSTGGHQSQSASHSATHGTEDDEFIQTFKRACEFTSGYGVAYPENIFNVSSHPLCVHSRTLVPGRMLPTARVTRVVDANIVQLEQEIPANGAWRLFVFAGFAAGTRASPALHSFFAYLDSPSSFYSRSRYSPEERSKISYHERHLPDSKFFSVATVFACHRAEIRVDAREMPALLRRYQSLVYADDRPEDTWRWVPGAKAAIHVKYGLPDEGAVVLVRPDGYIGIVVRLAGGKSAGQALEGYFTTF
ncbi:hypothetical protein FISHEDRAFT_16007, partial [Fistulina hepatica ATCC 64428]